MKFGTQYKQGDIVMTPYPFSDLSVTKMRPVLILSKEHNTEDIITCAITSNLKNEPNSIHISNTSLKEGKIPKPSRIKVDKLFTLDRKIIIKKVANIDTQTFQEVQETFQNLI
jgi:mRNA interferase MazF